MSKKYIEVPVVDKRKELAKKRITVLLFVSVFSFVGAVICTSLGFIHWGLLIAAVALEVSTAACMLLAFKTTMEYRNGGKHQGK